METVFQIDEHLKDKRSIFYLGEEFENYLSSSNPITPDEVFKLVEDEPLAVKAIGAMLTQFQKQWSGDSNGIDISRRPEILATLFNIGFEKSVPKKNPQSGGFVYYDLNGVEKNFGDRAYDWYISDKLVDIFPKRIVVLVSTQEQLGIGEIYDIEIDSEDNKILLTRDHFGNPYIEKYNLIGERLFKTSVPEEKTSEIKELNLDSEDNIYLLSDERKFDKYSNTEEIKDRIFKFDKSGMFIEERRLNLYAEKLFIDKEDNFLIVQRGDSPFTSDDILIYDKDFNFVRNFLSSIGMRIESIGIDNQNNYNFMMEKNIANGVSIEKRDSIEKHDGYNWNEVFYIEIYSGHLPKKIEIDENNNYYILYDNKISKLTDRGIYLWVIESQDIGGYITDIKIMNGLLYVTYERKITEIATYVGEGFIEVYNLEANLISSFP